MQEFGKIRHHVALSSTTWFRVGGKAEILFKPHDTQSLCAFMKNNKEPLTILGATSNLLIRDGGIPGITLKLGSAFLSLSREDDIIIAGAACFDRDVAQFAALCGLSGLEFLIGIPGTIGGAVFMNAGAYGGDIQHCLVWVDIITKEGDLKRLFAQDIPMSYRCGNLPQGCIVISAGLKGHIKDQALIQETMKDYLSQRESTQPIRARTGGSTFKNPEGTSAWRLIDQAGCRSLTFGDAQVSEKHCNFLINRGQASAYDLETLGETVRQRVLENSGILLDWEIKRIGKAA